MSQLLGHKLRNALTRGVLVCLLFSQALISFFLPQFARAASAPNIISYQGRLLNANGIPVSSASVSMIFELYTASSGGTCVWSNSSASCASATARTVTLTDGLFSEPLGDTSATYAAIADSIFGDNATLYLQVTVGGEALSPRKQILAAPYALNSDTVDGLDADTDGSTAGAIVALNSSGNVMFTGNPSGSSISAGSVFINPAAADTAANDTFFGIGDDGAAIFRVDKEGDVVAAGDYALNGGDLTSTSSTFNLLDAASNSTTIDIGGVTTNLGNTVNIATEGTSADIVAIGNSNASTVISITGGNDWSITQTGILTVSEISGNSGWAIGNGGEASFSSGNFSDDVIITGGDITSTAATFNFLDASGNSTTIDIGGVTTSLANTVNIATNATAADVIAIGNSHASSTLALTGGDDWSVTTAGAAIFDSVSIDNGSANINLEGTASATTSGAFVIGVFDEFTNSSSANVQDVLDDLDAAIGAGGSKWTDDGTFTYLTATTDDLVLGDSTVAGASLFFDESAGQLDVGTDSALGGALRLYSVTAATADPTLAADASGNLDITAAATELSGDLLITGGDLTSTSATFNFLDAASNSATIDIGGVTTDLGNTINVATSSTTADAITIGNTNASTTLALTGGDDWSMAATGVLTMSASAAATTAIVITDTDYTNALSIGDNAIIGTTANIDLTNFDVVGSSGNITSTGDLALNGGDFTSTSATFNFLDAASNSTTLDIGGVTTDLGNTINIATNATTADAITIGNSHDNTSTLLRGGDVIITGYKDVGGVTLQGNAIVLDAQSGEPAGGINLSTGTGGIDANTTTTTGNGLSVTTDALTSGNAFVVEDLSTTFSGNLALLNTTTAATGDFLEITSSSATATARAINIDLDNGNNNNDVFVLTTDETTNSGTAVDTVKARITASGEFLSDVGFTAGGASTRYRDGAISTSSVTTFDFNDASGSATTLDFGGVTTDLGNTINIATNSTTADALTIGNSNASTTLTLTGGDDWSMAATGVLTMSASAAATTAIVITDTDYTNALSVGDNAIIGTTANIDLTNFDVVGSSGDITSVGDLALNGGDLTSTSATFNFLDAASNSTTIDIGGVTTDLGNTINIATSSTTADAITVGNSNASTTLALTGGDDWSIDAAGAASVETLTATNTAAATQITLAGSLSSSSQIAVTATNSALTLLGNRTASQTSIADVITNTSVTRTAGNIFLVRNNSSDRMAVGYFGGLALSQSAGSTGTLQALAIDNANHTSQTASTEIQNISVDAYTRTWATGAITTQREVFFGRPTYAFAGSSTITDAATMYIENAPAAGTNATITNAYALWVDDGAVRIDGTATVGDLSCTDCLDFTELSDTLSLDASTTVSLSTGRTLTFIGAGSNSTDDITFNITGGGDFVVQDNGSDVVTVDSGGGFTYIGTGGSFNSTTATGFGLEVSTTGTTSGSAFKVTSSSDVFTTGDSASVQELGTVTTTLTRSGNVAEFVRNLTMNGGGQTLSLTGALVRIVNDNTVSAGTLTDTSELLDIDQTETTATGDVATINNVGTGTALKITQDVVANATTSETGQALAILVNETASNDEVILVLSDADGTPDAEFRLENDGDLFADGAAYNSGADYAEFFYTLDGTLENSYVVCRDRLNSNAVKRCETGNREIVGVVSPNPGFVGNNIPGAEGTLEGNPNYRIIGLQGQIDTYVTAADGPIAVGDPVTSSGIVAGYAGRANEAGSIIGFALEPLGAGQGLIKIHVAPQWYTASSMALSGDEMMLDKTGVATADVPGKSSNALVFRGSGWNGAAAEDVEFSLLTFAENSSNYRLSVQNTAGQEVAFVNDDGDLAIAGRLYLSNKGTLQTAKYLYYDDSGLPLMDYVRTNAAGFGTGSYDFAEMFPSPEPLVAGEVVVFGDAQEHVKRSTGVAYDDRLAGVVSTRPGFLAGNYKQGDYPIALAGRVPTLVTNENGAIAIGDPLTTSSRPGYAMKATQPGPVLGYAMESLPGAEGKIVAFIRASYYDGNGTNQAPVANNTVSGASTAVTDLNVSGSLQVNGSILGALSISSGTGKWSLDEAGNLMTEGRLVQLVRSYQNEQVETYAAASREMTIQLSGTTTLQSGFAQVSFDDIDPKFNDIVSNTAPYRVFVTPSGVTGQLYVTDRDQHGFIIHSEDAANGVLVDWLVIAYHKDYEPEPHEPIAESETEEVVEQPIVEETEETAEPVVAGESDEQEGESNGEQKGAEEESAPETGGSLLEGEEETGMMPEEDSVPEEVVTDEVTADEAPTAQDSGTTSEVSSL